MIPALIGSRIGNLAVEKHVDPDLCFDGWENVPGDFKTRQSWTLCHRSVIPGEKPSAIVITKRLRTLETTRTEYTVEQSYKLFHLSQTRATRQTPLQLARLAFFENFSRHADRQRLIRMTQGESKEGVWDPTADVWGWRTFQEHLGLDGCIDHIAGREIYGVFGAETSSYLLIDLDLHNNSVELFRRRFQVLLNAFHGRCRCHLQVAEENAGGVHFFLFFGKEGLLATRRKWITNELVKLDSQFPDVSFTKTGKLNIEVFPNTSSGHRLPLCRGRTMLLDRPLPLIRRGKQSVQDVVAYVNWLNNPHRQYMDREEIFDYVKERLDLSLAGVKKPRREKPSPGASLVVLPLKGRTRGAIVGFWQRGEKGHFANLNVAIVVTLRALHAEGLAMPESVERVKQYVDELPNNDLSSRLSSKKTDIYRVIEADAKMIWSGQSSQKWQKVIMRWEQIGFRVSDKATWIARHQTVINCKSFEFTEEETNLLINEMAPLLVGSKQALKEGKQQEVIGAVRFFLCYVHCHRGEIPRDALPIILKNFDLKLGMDRKRQEFLRLLCQWNWLNVQKDYYCPKQFGKSGRGRARAYGIGEAMLGKFAF